MYMGAKVYNELPLDIRQTETFKEFVEKLKMHFVGHDINGVTSIILSRCDIKFYRFYSCTIFSKTLM